MPDGSIGTVETLQERLDLLANLAANGNNRYVKVLVYYYFPRAAIVSLFFMVSNLLNKRTYRLLDDEIKIHDEREKAKTELSVAKDIQMNTPPRRWSLPATSRSSGSLRPPKKSAATSMTTSKSMSTMSPS
jgi:hypothetical protein